MQSRRAVPCHERFLPFCADRLLRFNQRSEVRREQMVPDTRRAVFIDDLERPARLFLRAVDLDLEEIAALLKLLRQSRSHKHRVVVHFLAPITHCGVCSETLVLVRVL